MTMTPAQPLITVVIAAYRSDEVQLRAAIASALSQTHREIEVLVNDDSPDDRLRPLVAAFADDRIVYRHHRPALGVAANHADAFARARGELVAILNHDDGFEPAFLSTLATALAEQPDAVLAFCDHWIIDAQGERLVEETDRNTAQWGRATLAPGLHRPFEALVVSQTIPIAMGTLFRRRSLRALPPQAGPAYDLWLSFLLCHPGTGAVYVPQRLSRWRAHAGNLTSAAGMAWLEGGLSCWQAIDDEVRYVPFRDQVRSQLALAHYRCAMRSRRDGRSFDGARSAWRSLTVQPSLRGVAALLLSALPARPARHP